MSYKMFKNLNDVILNNYFFVGGVFLSYLVYRILHSIFCDSYYIQTKYKSRGHTWRSIQCNKSIPYNIYCTICGKLMLALAGGFCECCGVSACKGCRRSVDKKFKCKQITWPEDKPFYHHWVDIGSTRRESAIDTEEPSTATRYFCSWCQRINMYHTNAVIENEPCDLQKYKHILIPPSSVQIERGIIKKIKPVLDTNWEPLIIFANRKSGSNKSDEVLSLFRGLLNPIQVIDLAKTPPERVVQWLPSKCRVLAAGGDGTVAWVLNTLKTAPHINASVAILPMGTGNDLSRVLGWGATCTSPIDAHSIINAVMKSEEQLLDRWKVTIKPKQTRLGRLRPERTLYAYNYASIGVDAQVALDFHHARRQFLYRYASRTVNYLAYLVLGAGRALDDGGCSALEKRLRVRVDGAALALPPLQALLAVNIPSWGAGVDLWNLGSEEDVAKQSISDGKIEVIGISSSFHIARLRCGLAEPYRFAQASKIKIELNGSCAMQVDGEPWMQSAATILLEPEGQCTMLRANTSEI